MRGKGGIRGKKGKRREKCKKRKGGLKGREEERKKEREKLEIKSLDDRMIFNDLMRDERLGDDRND